MTGCNLIKVLDRNLTVENKLIILKEDVKVQ